MIQIQMMIMAKPTDWVKASLRRDNFRPARQTSVWFVESRQQSHPFGDSEEIIEDRRLANKGSVLPLGNFALILPTLLLS